MSDDKETVLDWCIVAFIAGAVACGLAMGSCSSDDEDPDVFCRPRVYSMYDFNLAPYDVEGNLVTNPVFDLYVDPSDRYLVAVMVNPDTDEPFHFQSITRNTRICDLDIEFAVCKKLFEYDDREKVVDAFGKMKNNPQGKNQ